MERNADSWRAGCGESRTSGSEGGVEKRTDEATRSAPTLQGQLLTGNAAAAWGARLADVDYIPAFPITPQTEIIELLAQWSANGDLPARFVSMDSEHSMLTVAGVAAAAGARVFTATSSQGLLYGFEVLYTIAGWRVPLVLVNVSRALGWFVLGLETGVLLCPLAKGEGLFRQSAAVVERIR